MTGNPAGMFAMVNVERYDSHAVVGYRHKPGSSLFGIELEDGAHEWPKEFLQFRACELLDIPRDQAGQVQVIDF